MAMACSSFPRWGWRQLLVSALVLMAAHRGNAADPQRLNHLQVLHAHNSYHTCPLPNMQALFASAAGQMVAQKLPANESPSMWYYGKPSLLSLVRDYGVRALEIDMVYDPTGGRYQFRAGPKLAASIGGSNSTGLDGGAALATPGWKVMHIPDLDFQTSCNTVTECLGPIAKWSATNPGHTPLFISFELRSWNPFKLLGPADLGLVQNLLGAGGPPNNLTTSPTPDKSHMLALQAELLKVFKRQQLFTPDDFRGKYASLQARITADGWPEYRQVKGKMLLRLISADYTGVARSLWPGSQGSLFFLEDTYYGGGVLVTTEDVVFIQIDWSIVWGNQNPAVANISYTAPAAQWQTPAVADAYRAEVANIVGIGKYMVRAFTDSPVAQARANFKGFANAAAAGGAHLLHTDYPNGWKSSCVFTSDYTVPLQQVWSGTWQAGSATSRATTSWKGKASSKKLASSCNPVTALKACRTYAAGKKQPPAYCACYKQV